MGKNTKITIEQSRVSEGDPVGGVGVIGGKLIFKFNRPTSINFEPV